MATGKWKGREAALERANRASTGVHGGGCARAQHIKFPTQHFQLRTFDYTTFSRCKTKRYPFGEFIVIGMVFD